MKFQGKLQAKKDLIFYEITFFSLLRRLNYQMIPSKILATVKEDCVKTTIRIMCVHAYWPN